MPKRATSKTKRVTMAEKATAPAATGSTSGPKKTIGAPGTAMPPRKGAPAALPPIATTVDQKALAPWPINDRFPTVIGQSLNLSYLSMVFRLCTTGYRQQYVDLLSELLEQDPHLRSVIDKRILAVANGRVEIVPFEVAEDSTDAELAKKVCDLVREEFARIPDMTSNLAALLWALYWGVACAEIFWTRDADGWHVQRLEFVHSRRLAYPDYQSWDLFIWDQGQVYGWDSPWGTSPTNSTIYGLRVADWYGKFITFAPGARGEYPTREGLGRNTSSWATFKRVGVRGSIDYLERFAKGFVDVTYNTADPDDEKPGPREATNEDIALANTLAAAIGPGSGSYAVHPDAIKFEPKSYEGTGTAKLTWPEWISICNAEMSKTVLGGTLGTEVDKAGGNRSLGEVMERAECDLEQFDATTLGEALKRDLVEPIVRLNMPEALHLLPSVNIHVETDPSPKALTATAMELTEMGLPVDGDKLSDRVGIPLVPNEAGPDGKMTPRRTFYSLQVDPTSVDPNLESEESKQAKADDVEHQRSVDIMKAQQPTIVGPGGKAAGPPGKGAPSGKAAAPGKAPPKGAAPAAKKKGVAQLTDKIALDYESRIEAMQRHLLADRRDAAPAQMAYDQLLDDYPASACGWVLSGDWESPRMVDISEIDFSQQSRWRAYKEQLKDPASIGAYAERIQNGKRKPVVLVRTPGNPKLQIVDGHHRTLASKQLGWPVLAFVCEMQVDDGPWVTLHAMQTKGSSRTSASFSEPASYEQSDEIDDNA